MRLPPLAPDRRLLVALVAAVTVCVLVVVALSLLGADRDRGAGSAAGDGASAGATPSAGASTGSAPRRSGTGSEQPTRAAQPSPGATPLPGLRKRRDGRLAVPQPRAAAAATGRLVSGYPVGAVPVPARASVRSSSVAGSAGRVQASVDGTFPGTTEALASYYRRELGKHGLTGVQGASGRGTQTLVFSDGESNVTLTLRPRPRGGVRFTVFSVLRAQA